MSGRRWYVVATHSRAEAIAVRHLADQGFEVYGPELPRKIVNRRITPPRTEIVGEPMFPGYVLVRLDLDADRWGKIRSTVGCKHLLPAGAERPKPLPSGVVVALRAQVEEAREKLTRKPSAAEPAFEVQQEVRVVDGTFAGFNGVCEMATAERVRVLLWMFGRQTPVELSVGQVEAVD